MKRSATAVWNGSGKEGKGRVSAPSGILKETAYSYVSRFENGTGTNPEELIAAAHASCYAMKLSFVLGAAGLTPDLIESTCEITLDNGIITASHLTVQASVPGATAEIFKACAEDAKMNCPVSKLLNASITLDATLKA